MAYWQHLPWHKEISNDAAGKLALEIDSSGMDFFGHWELVNIGDGIFVLMASIISFVRLVFCILH